MVQDIQAKLKTVESNSDIVEYLTSFFLSYDIPRATLVRLGFGTEIPADKEFIIGNKMFCTYTKAVNLYAKFDQVQRTTIKNKKYRFVMLINDTEILALDTSNGEWLFSARNDIHSNFEFFLPLAGIERSTISEKKNASVKVGEKFAQFYNEIIILNPEKEDDISVLLVNLVATLFSDSCGILNQGAVHHLVDLYSKKDGSDLEKLLCDVFDAIAGEEKLPEYILSDRCGTLKGLPKYKGNLSFDAKTRKTLISLCELNWDSIEPEVIGALIQAILNPEDASIAYNYTSTANVYKVIGPLFMDDLFEAYESGKREGTLTAELLDKLASIRVLDPACGTGNFLMICYKEMKKLEMLIKYYCKEKSIPVSEKQYVTLSSFYGIEHNYIATEVSRIGLAFSEQKVDSTASLDVELPIKTICNGQALLMDWDAFCPKDGITYIVGNPSYKGAHSLDPEQQKGMKATYSEEIVSGFKIGELDMQ
ncbi:MAG: DNA methyltransferase, partial [Dysgonomonas sp.]